MCVEAYYIGAPETQFTAEYVKTLSIICKCVKLRSRSLLAAISFAWLLSPFQEK